MLRAIIRLIRTAREKPLVSSFDVNMQILLSRRGFHTVLISAGANGQYKVPDLHVESSRQIVKNSNN